MKDIIELSYLQSKWVVIFKCDWRDLSDPKGIQIDEHKIISLNTNKTWYNKEPFILSCQAQQVFYIIDTNLGKNWRVIDISQP